MLRYRSIVILFSVLIVVLSACKKASLTDDALNSPYSPVNIPTKPSDDASKPAKDTSNKVIVILGSSTAAGFGATSPDSCWVGRLKLRMTKDKKNVKIINLGIGGYTTYQLMPTGQLSAIPNRPRPDTNANVTAALKYQPDLVIINLPSNDIAANYRDEEILKNYRTIIRLVASARSSYLLTGTQPRNFNQAAMRNRLKILNDKLVSDFPQNVHNYFMKLATPSYAMQRIYNAGDGVHLNNRGHNLVYQTMMTSPVLKTVAGY
ncbi:SGNH/GDSL hydrolase family protein [Mucilaginibacter daejeonensis]|uniref:SGNH/GDSL hydrolase family protein n=1 Tax=Mucilaginibacter daejeonensis TaxID=398049 RepID=UPI001D1780AE|nr:SGNH/GDSL hydrolase family protein [Mucilaginibacter daejeonensis]UEG53904.1 SGNH/GDSL hydrolase family protein [Mucilaginibacter daejeonensis]